MVSLIEWASLFKNLRGVVLFPKEPDEGKVKWLVRKHRYRRLGIAPSFSPLVEQPALRKVPFVTLSFPAEELQRLSEILSRKAEKYVVESLILSCCYSSPLIVTDERLFVDLEPFVLWSLRSNQRLGEKDLIFHLRVASYVIIDFFALAKEAYEALGDLKKLRKHCEKRRKASEKDGRKRFWRIPEDPEGKIICAYLDLLPALLEELEGGNPSAASLIRSEWTAFALPITCAFSLGGQGGD